MYLTLIFIGNVGWGDENSYFRGNLGGWYNSEGVTGRGPYNVRKNSLWSALDLGQSPPMVRNTASGEGFVVNHREYLGDLLSGTGAPTAFTIQTLNLNPGNSLLFPFLNRIAQNFQEYEVRGMLVELKTLSSDYAASLSMGSVFMSADYNVLADNPTTKQQIENMEYSSSSKPSRTLVMPIECDPHNDAQTHLFIAHNGQYNNGDARLYDLAKIHIGSSGIPTANTPIAEIWVSYEVVLFKPRLPLDLIEMVSFNCTNLADNAPFGTLPSHITKFEDGLNGSVSIVGDQIRFALTGTYLLFIDYFIDGAGTIDNPGAFVPDANIAAASPYWPGVAGDFSAIWFDAQESTAFANTSWRFAVQKASVLDPAKLTIGSFAMTGGPNAISKVIVFRIAHAYD